MSSHREAPSISKDPVADNTDVYAFRSENNTVTIIGNFIPGEAPAGGPNFYEFGDDVLYEIKIDNDADAEEEIVFQFRFQTVVANPNTFLYNVGPITSLTSPNWVRRQVYSVTRLANGNATVLGSGLTCPPCNIGPRSTPNYAALAADAVHTLPGGIKVFCGQRADPFFVDLGSVFDLGTLRPFQNLHLIPMAAANGVDTLKNANVHSIALQVPIGLLTRDGSVPNDPMAAKSVLGIYVSASRQKGSVRDAGVTTSSGPWEQVSRLANPLINEVIIPMSLKDTWNGTDPSTDAQFKKFYEHPELAKLLPVLYPGVFPHLAAYTKSRVDLIAILGTGIPAGVVPGFQNSTGPVFADLLRLNVAIPPSAHPNRLGLIGGDAAGFPNGRRLGDDIIAIELRAVAGVAIPLVDPSFTPDAAAALLEDGTYGHPGRTFLPGFPYVGTPYSGFEVPAA
jgi:Domain of unknown function (DUF4331)